MVSKSDSPPVYWGEIVTLWKESHFKWGKRITLMRENHFEKRESFLLRRENYSEERWIWKESDILKGAAASPPPVFLSLENKKAVPNKWQMAAAQSLIFIWAPNKLTPPHPPRYLLFIYNYPYLFWSGIFHDYGQTHGHGHWCQELLTGVRFIMNWMSGAIWAI